MHAMTARDPTRAAETNNDACMTLREQMRRDGFAFAPAAQMKALLASVERPAGWNDDWQRFASSWNDLLLDTYLPEGHRYRRLRHATRSPRSGQIPSPMEPRQAHSQF